MRRGLLFLVATSICLAFSVVAAEPDSVPWQVAKVSKLDTGRASSRSTNLDTGPLRYLHLELDLRPTSDQRKLHEFRVVDGRGETVGELWGHSAKKSLLVFESETSWSDLAGLYLDGLGHREPLFRAEQRARATVSATPMPPSNEASTVPSTGVVSPRSTYLEGSGRTVIRDSVGQVVPSDDRVVVGSSSGRVVRGGGRTIGRDGADRVIRHGDVIVREDGTRHTHVDEVDVEGVMGLDDSGIGAAGVGGLGGDGDGIGDSGGSENEPADEDLPAEQSNDLDVEPAAGLDPWAFDDFGAGRYDDLLARIQAGRPIAGLDPRSDERTVVDLDADREVSGGVDGGAGFRPNRSPITSSGSGPVGGTASREDSAAGTGLGVGSSVGALPGMTDGAPSLGDRRLGANTDSGLPSQRTPTADEETGAGRGTATETGQGDGANNASDGLSPPSSLLAGDPSGAESTAADSGDGQAASRMRDMGRNGAAQSPPDGPSTTETSPAKGASGAEPSLSDEPSQGADSGPGMGEGSGLGESEGPGPGEGEGPGPGDGGDSGAGGSAGPDPKASAGSPGKVGEGPVAEPGSESGDGAGANAGDLGDRLEGLSGPVEKAPPESGSTESTPTEMNPGEPGSSISDEPMAAGPAPGAGGTGAGAGGPGGSGDGFGPNYKNLAPQFGPRYRNVAPDRLPDTPDYRGPVIDVFNPEIPYFDPRVPMGYRGGAGIGYGDGTGLGRGGGYRDLARGGGSLEDLPPLPKVIPEIVLYISCGEDTGPGMVYQVDDAGRVLGVVKLPHTATGLALHRGNGLIACMPRDGGEIVRIDDTGKVSTILEKDKSLVHPIDVGVSADSDTIVVADNISDVLAATSVAGSEPILYRRLEGQELDRQSMSVAVTRDRTVIFGTNGEEGIYRFRGDNHSAAVEPILPGRGGVAADISTLKWAATQSPNRVLVFEGNHLVTEFKVAAGKSIYAQGLLSFAPSGAVVVANRHSDEVVGEVWLTAYEIEGDEKEIRALFPWNRERMVDFVVGPRMIWERNSPSKYKSIY